MTMTMLLRLQGSPVNEIEFGNNQIYLQDLTFDKPGNIIHCGENCINRELIGTGCLISRPNQRAAICALLLYKEAFRADGTFVPVLNS